MTTERTTTTHQGDRNNNNVQCPVVSSTSEVYNTPFQSKFRIRGRPTYRRLSLNTNNPSMGSPSSQAPPTHSSKIETPAWSSTIVALVCVLAIGVASLYGIYYILCSTFPAVTEEELQQIKWPWNLEDLKGLATVLNRYKDDHYLQVILGISLFYVFLQAFAIPGSAFLSVLSGYLFSFPVAMLLVCTCSALGASLCYLLSQAFTKTLAMKLMPGKIEQAVEMISEHRSNIFYYMLFLRITPMLPNWAINLSAPVVGVPLMPFAWGTFFGVFLPSVLTISSGQSLQNIKSMDDLNFSFKNYVLLAVCAFVPILMIFFKSWLKKKVD